MVLDGDDLAATREMDALKGAQYIREGVLIVALVRPPPSPDVPRMIATFPRKALMNLVTDLCETRYCRGFHPFRNALTLRMRYVVLPLRGTHGKANPKTSLSNARGVSRLRLWLAFRVQRTHKHCLYLVL